jgi:alpha-1,2-mannosyltransferase
MDLAARRLGAAALRTVAIAAVVLVQGLIILSAVSAGTFAFDFLAYHAAAQRVLAGERLYDPSVQVTGGFGLFYYPPPFVLFMLPFGLLPSGMASGIWVGISVAMLVAAIAIFPVRSSVRWATLLAAGLSWPVAYALKLGQVGPLLLLLFTIGWRWLDRPARFGVAGALGAIVKIQPGLVLAWALLTRRWMAVAIGAGGLAVAALAAMVVAGGPSVWIDYIALLRNVSDPITTPHNFTPGAVAYQTGAPVAAAVAIQVASSIAAVAAVIVAGLRLRPDASFLIAVIASQLLSPVLWDHYAMLLLLPVAWLLERRQWWAIAIPLSTSVLLLPIGLPPIVIPIGFWATMLALLAIGWRQRAELVQSRRN